MITPSPTPRRPDQDERPSNRMYAAALMLRRGRDPHQIAEQTGVPLALVELIDEHLDTHPAASPPPPTPAHLHDQSRYNLDAHEAAGADLHPPARPAELLSPQLNDTQTGHSRRRTRTIIALALALLVDSGLTASVVITHNYALGAAAVLLSALLLTVALLHAMCRSPRGRLQVRGQR
jgi:hypothetical protein